jgi:hypothetical protein
MTHRQIAQDRSYGVSIASSNYLVFVKQNLLFSQRSLYQNRNIITKIRRRGKKKESHADTPSPKIHKLSKDGVSFVKNNFVAR